jgi:hypothetical protein
MAAPILAPIANSLSTHFNSEDLNTLQVLGYQINALATLISQAATTKQSDTLKALATFAVLVQLNFDDFKEDLEARTERRGTNKNA